MYLICRHAKLTWHKMTSNSHRFIPMQWLQAARAQQSSYQGNSYFCEDTLYGNKWSNDRRTFDQSQGSYSQYPADNRYSFGARQNGDSRRQRSKDKQQRKNKNAAREKRPTNMESYTAPAHAGGSTSSMKKSRQPGSFNHKISEWHSNRQDKCIPSQSNSTVKKIHPYMVGYERDRFRGFKGFSHSYISNRQKSDVPSISGSPNVAASSDGINHEEINKKYKLTRDWEDIQLPNNVRIENLHQKKRLRIVSYNILSQKLLDINFGLYKKCDPNVLPWEYRWPSLEKEIRKLDPNVLCLQEVEECHYQDHIFNFFEGLGYQCHYKRRTSRNPNKPDGVLTAYKREHFQLVAEKKVEYYRGEIPMVNQHNVGLITLLKPIFNEEVQRTQDDNTGMICVVNTHLLYSPRRGDIKLVQLSTLFAEVHQLLSYFPGTIPILLCGDLNSRVNSLLFDFITKQHIYYKDFDSKHVSGQKVKSHGRIQYLPDPLLPHCLNISQECCKNSSSDFARAPNGRIPQETHRSLYPFHLQHSLGPLKSVHDHHEEEASTTQDNGITVDYIFHSCCTSNSIAPTSEDTGTHSNQSTEGVALLPMRRMRLVSPESLKNVSSIPNVIHSSDHLPIAAEFLITPIFELSR